jgi:hypothetical protein
MEQRKDGFLLKDHETELTGLARAIKRHKVIDALLHINGEAEKRMTNIELNRERIKQYRETGDDHVVEFLTSGTRDLRAQYFKITQLKGAFVKMVEPDMDMLVSKFVDEFILGVDGVIPPTELADKSDSLGGT